MKFPKNREYYKRLAKDEGNTDIGAGTSLYKEELERIHFSLLEATTALKEINKNDKDLVLLSEEILEKVNKLKTLIQE